MESGTRISKSRDILSSPWRALALFRLPAVAIVVTGIPILKEAKAENAKLQ
jgi:hypothetical protein